MKPIRNFEEFIKENIVKKQTPDKSRAGFLISESKMSYNLMLELLEKMKVTEKNVNMFVKECYDTLMGLIRAKMLLDGYNASGFGAHEAEVAYMRNMGFSEQETQFADQMRFFRNGMLYYGTRLDKEYAEKVIEFTKKTYPKLKEMVK